MKHNKNKIKILFINRTSNFGGAEIVLLRYLKNAENIIPILLLPKGRLKTEIESIGIKVYRSLGLGELKRDKDRLWPIKFIFRYIFAFFEIISVCLIENPQIIYSNTFTATVYAWLPAKIYRKSLIWHMHDIFPVNSLEAKVCKFLDNKVDKIICVSYAVKKRLKAFGISDDKIEIIYNGIDAEFLFNPTNYETGLLKKEYNIGPNTILIGMIGSLVRHKGFHVFINSVNKILNTGINNTKFIIVGNSWDKKDTYRQELLSFTKQKALNSRIIFTGERRNIPEILADLDIIVHASIIEDSLPTVILEAMAMQKIVIASNIGGVPEIIEDYKDGILFAPGNASDLANKIIWVLNHSKIANTIAENARHKIVNMFNTEIKKNKLSKVFSEII